MTMSKRPEQAKDGDMTAQADVMCVASVPIFGQHTNMITCFVSKSATKKGYTAVEFPNKLSLR